MAAKAKSARYYSPIQRGLQGGVVLHRVIKEVVMNSKAEAEAPKLAKNKLTHTLTPRYALRLSSNHVHPIRISQYEASINYSNKCCESPSFRKEHRPISINQSDMKPCALGPHQKPSHV